MGRPGGPEEFFEVFRKVQETKKGRDEGAEVEAPPVERPRGPQATPAALGEPGAVSLSYPAAAGAVVIVVLLLLAAYLVGRQHGWVARERAARRPTTGEAAKASTPAPVPGVADEPELVSGTIFTLLTLGKADEDLDSVTKEAEYLNGYAPFRALQVQAYVWRDRAGKYRVCARGLKALDEPTRKHVRDQIRGLMSRHGKREYRDADFLSP